jgi:hypothetical protein
MRHRVGLFSLAAAVAVVASASAQQWPDTPGAKQWPEAPPPQAQPKAKPKPTPRRAAPRDDVEELTPGQIERAQERDPPPGTPKSAPKGPPKTAAAPPARSLNCSGAFARDSSHIRLVQVFGPGNVIYDQVDGPDGSKLPASILFPKDPRRRVEVLWDNEQSRSGTQLVVINGQSGWTAPRGLKLGLALAALEKINGKPFKLSAFGADGSSVAGWEGGTLSALPGGCKIGLRLVADQRAPEEARSKVAAAQEQMSSDAGVRAVRATVAEIFIGY